MSKKREAVTCNGRPAFYASMYEDIRKCAMDSGWAVALHGSLSSDMDIMAMPWAKEAIKFEELVNKISRLFDENSLSENYTITYDEKSHNRIVATIPIWADFYIDISTIEAVPVVQGEWIRHKPNKGAMEEFRKMGVGKGMSVNSIYWTCSNCGNWGTPRHKYCNKCGAKMKGGAE